ISHRELCGHTRRRYEAPELSFNQFSKSDRRMILEIGSDDLNTDWQSGRRMTNRRNGGREAASGGRVHPHVKCVVVGMRFAINFDVPRLNRQRMVMRESWNGCRRVENDIPFTKEPAPLLLNELTGPKPLFKPLARLTSSITAHQNLDL